jgi:hypothetical protein
VARRSGEAAGGASDVRAAHDRADDHGTADDERADDHRGPGDDHHGGMNPR